MHVLPQAAYGQPQILQLPESKAVPPLEAAYQSVVEPAGGVAEILTVPVPHLDPLPAVGAAGTVFTVAITVVLLVDIQPLVVFRA